MIETQQKASALSYRDRYKNYLHYHANKEKKRLNLKPWQYSNHIKPMPYSLWLKYSATSDIPADCRAGQGKEPWQL